MKDKIAGISRSIINSHNYIAYLKYGSVNKVNSSFAMTLLSYYLLTFLILNILLFLFPSMTKVFAQNNSRHDDKIPVCDLVQYCSNPIVMNTTVTKSDTISQTKPAGDIQTSTNSTNPEL